MKVTESTTEEATRQWFSEQDYPILNGPVISPDGDKPERKSYDQVVLINRLKNAVSRLNPKILQDAQEEAIRKVLVPQSPSLSLNNQAFHKMLVEGVPVEYKRSDDSIKGDWVRLIDFDKPEENDWLAVIQFTVIENNNNRRPDVVIFINGLPIAVIELKSPGGKEATIWTAYNQLQTYKLQIPSLFTYNEILVISDGTAARFGSLTAKEDRFMPWRTIEGDELAAKELPEMKVLIKGLFDKQRLLDYIRHFVVFDTSKGGEPIKKIAGYHQFHAVNEAVDSTIKATRPRGDKRCGVVWHTQGSGKSLTMAFLAGKIILQPEMENPTLVVITDRNDLDGQLFDTFSGCQELLRQSPVQAESRAHLRELLKVASGGVVFTTVQKFFPDIKGDQHPLLSERRNVVVIADEAHRTQYDFIDGFARHMRDALPNASFIGFTGTPIELHDKNTRAVFGDYISVYDIQQAVDDHATVPIFYESRLAKLELDEELKPRIDPEFEEVTEGEELEEKEKLKTKWAALEAIVGTEKRIKVIAKDLVEHFETRIASMDGKAMIVCMSRRICVELYKAIIELRPGWHDDDDYKGKIKIVMTGAANDPVEWQQHIRNKPRRCKLADRFRDTEDHFKMVIVRDMWLTGFDAPSLHTMYVDKPMRGHGLMQAIARVNRVFRDKPGGLIVDYIGLAYHLKKALADYTSGGGSGTPAEDFDRALPVLMENYEICRGLFHGFDWSSYCTGSPTEKMEVLKAADEHVLSLEKGKDRLREAVLKLSRAFALVSTHEDAIRIRDDVGFFQTVNVSLSKPTLQTERTREEIELAIQQIVSQAVATEDVLDIFKLAKVDKPDISILSDEFLDEVKEMPQKNLAAELLRRLLNNEIKTRAKKNLVQSRSFAEMLERTITAYHNRTIETLEVLEELIKLAKELREAHYRGDELGLTEDELAFYDALETNDSAVAVLGDAVLCQIARELVEKVRSNLTIDWSIRNSARAHLRRLVKRTLRKYNYPPDKQESATQTVLRQTELLCEEWAA